MATATITQLHPATTTPTKTRAEGDNEVALENGFAFGDKLWHRIGT